MHSPIWLTVFCSSLISCFPSVLLRYFLNDLETVPVSLIITGVTFDFTFHMLCMSIVRFLYFRIFWATLVITFLSPEIEMSINIHVPFSLSLRFYYVRFIIVDGSVSLHLFIP